MNTFKAGRAPIFAAVSALLFLAGCAAGPRLGAGAPTETGEWRGRAGVQDAIALLNRGDPARARRRLMTVLRREPSDGIARDLVAQIDADPRQVLGAESYAYTLRDGETLSTVAQRALGNPMKFYILARYNDIAVPENVRPGQVIRIPGRPPAPPPERRPARPAPDRTEPARPSPSRPVVPARPAANPALAARLRTQGLAALNGGQVARAVSLLSQAAAADPGNGAIRQDLERARRVQRTVRSRR